MVASVIDTNCLVYFQHERVSGSPSVFTAMVDCVLGRGVIAIDDEGKAQQEYYDCCRPSAVGLNLNDWISDQIVVGKIKMFTMDKSCEKKLGQLGLPPKDKKWVSIAKGATADLIVTEDSDLFDPVAKSWGTAKKQKLEESCAGCIATYLRKSHNIHVRVASMVPAFCADA